MELRRLERGYAVGHSYYGQASHATLQEDFREESQQAVPSNPYRQLLSRTKTPPSGRQKHNCRSLRPADPATKNRIPTFRNRRRQVPRTAAVAGYLGIPNPVQKTLRRGPIDRQLRRPSKKSQYCF